MQSAVGDLPAVSTQIMWAKHYTVILIDQDPHNDTKKYNGGSYWGVGQLMGMVRNKHFLASSFNEPAELMVVVAEVHCKHNYTRTVKK